MKIYRLYAERHRDYGQSCYGYYLHKNDAEKVRDDEHEKIKTNKDKTTDGYYLDDWHIEEIEVEE